ncbi:heterokaryon incompatibility protein-domain-containing protein [Podospora didyma]|uniref:Heterokaryon incompatibility protein-domain-containing protein n=1 Tax=Podospora didyma TaxID=330526 RepID=A0AAE0N906_9PEZI|nr:heterokaryon incompatibility protein-domain-containing protein [Podospora didyma]
METQPPVARDQSTPTHRRQLSFKLVKQWAQSCEDLHGGCATVGNGLMRDAIHPPSQPLELILIDIEENRLVKTNSFEPPYLALSYVWGKDPTFLKTTKFNVDLLQEPGALATPQIKATLARVFIDAMELTAKLGKRFLWIDALCIVQDDDTQKHSQLEMMHLIYSQAVLTIVDLAGSDANFGLRGVSSPVEPQLLSSATTATEDLDQEAPAVPQSVPNFETAILSSVHSTRGWTFQEVLLSRRCLYFTETQCFFRCGRTLISDVSGENVAPLSPALDMGLSLALGVLGAVDRSFFTYRSIVALYTRRTLSFDTDILNAFAGIMAFRSQIYHEFYGKRSAGLGNLSHSARLLWVSADGNATDQQHRRREIPPHPQPGASSDHRQQHFPNWSWAGWKNTPVSHVTYDLWRPTDNGTLTKEYHDQDTVGLIQWWAIKMPSAAGEDKNQKFEFVVRRDVQIYGQFKRLTCGPRCGVTLPVPEKIPGSRRCPPDMKHLHLLQLCAFTASASGLFVGDSHKLPLSGLGDRALNAAAKVAAEPLPRDLNILGLYDKKGRRYGGLLNPPPQLLSEKGGNLDGYLMIGVNFFRSCVNFPGLILGFDEEEPWLQPGDDACLCIVNFLLVERAGNIHLRVAVGQMSAAAWCRLESSLEAVTLA